MNSLAFFFLFLFDCCFSSGYIYETHTLLTFYLITRTRLEFLFFLLLCFFWKLGPLKESLCIITVSCFLCSKNYHGDPSIHGHQTRVHNEVVDKKKIVNLFCSFLFSYESSNSIACLAIFLSFLSSTFLYQKTTWHFQWSQYFDTLQSLAMLCSSKWKTHDC